MLKIRSDVIESYNLFKPKIHFDEIEYYLQPFEEKQVENNKVYTLVERLTNLAYPTQEDQYDKRWEYFYIPIRRGGRTIAIPMWIMEYNKDFYLSINSFGNLHIKKGEQNIEKYYYNLISEAIKFVTIIKKDVCILQKIIPYDIRTGKIKGIYVLAKPISRCMKNTILKQYKEHIEKNIHIKDISLNDYLYVASICYNAAYREESKSLSNIDMYKRWADGRDGGMLSIKDWDSKEEFYNWNHSGKYVGSHPFEIVFSWHGHGIHLYPPTDYSEHYELRITNYSYAPDYIKMVKQLIKMQIPFCAKDLNDVVNYLAGDTFFTVNKGTDHDHFKYIPTKEFKKKYFPHIEWDEIKVVKWI